jgi:hypothetical protein
METNELELNRWAHELLGLCWHDWRSMGPGWGYVCGRCRQTSSFSGKPDYCSSLDLAAKVEAKAIEMVGWLKYSEAIWDLLIAEVSFSILRWPAIMRRYTTLPALTRVQAAKRAVEGK